VRTVRLAPTIPSSCSIASHRFLVRP
jgi:hypothetical protein